MIKSNKVGISDSSELLLSKYDDAILFKEKLERAKKTLSRVGIPEKWRKEFEAKKSSV
jgi:hypothetical protein